MPDAIIYRTKFKISGAPSLSFLANNLLIPYLSSCWDIFRNIYEKEGIKFTFKIWSYTGSIKRVQAKSADVAVGAYINEVDNVIYPKNQFAVDVVQVLYKKGLVKNWQGDTSIEGKRVAWNKGYAYDDYLKIKVKKMEFEARKSILKGLNTGRIDFFIDAAAEIQDQIAAGKIDPTEYERKVLFKLKLYVVFSKNNRGKELSEVFDHGVNKMIKSGALKKMYDHYIVDKKANFTYPY